MKDKRDRITSSYRCNNGMETVFPDEQVSIAEALSVLLMFHLCWGGKVYSDRATELKATSHVLGRLDLHTITGSETDIAALKKACDFYLGCKKDLRPVLAEIERLIAPTGVIIDQDCYKVICSALLDTKPRACLTMMIACGINDQFDLAHGITHFRKLMHDTRGWGTRLMVDLLELYLDQPSGGFKHVIEQVGY